MQTLIFHVVKSTSITDPSACAPRSSFVMAAAEAGAASGAPEHGAAHDTPLAELVGGSASFGRWTLKVCGDPKETDYSYKGADGQSKEGK